MGSDIQESLPDILEYRETGKLLTRILLYACITGMQAVETVYKPAVVLINHERLEQVEHSLTELCHGEVRDTRDACLIMGNDSGRNNTYSMLHEKFEKRKRRKREKVVTSTQHKSGLKNVH